MFRLFKTFLSAIVLCCAITASAQKTAGKVEFISDTTANFDQMVGQFKGRIVFVDFWASWCVPCRHELEQKKAITAFAEFAQKKNIAILYISGDQDEKGMKSYLAKNPLNGYHAFASFHLKNEIRSRFAVPKSIRHPEAGTAFFIPRHMIIDASGRMIDNNADIQGSDKVYKQLKQLLAAN